MEITGRIFTINILGEKYAQIIIKRKVRGKQVANVFTVFGKWKFKMEAMKLRKNEKIYAKFYMDGKIYKGKWYADIWMEEIERIPDKVKPEGEGDKMTLFNDGSTFIENQKRIIDEETGEILL
jgi:hypothetical protein